MQSRLHHREDGTGLPGKNRRPFFWRIQLRPSGPGKVISIDTEIRVPIKRHSSRIRAEIIVADQDRDQWKGSIE